MPRKAKMPRGEGRNRTIFLRNGQTALLRDAAVDYGLDPSDLVRAYIDWFLPSSALNRRVYLRSRVEENWLQLTQFPAVTRALLDGWAGREMHVPVGLPTAERDARLLPETVELLRRLELPPPTGSKSPNHEQAATPPSDRPGEALRPAALQDWAATASWGLLTVFTSPAALVLTAGPGGRPDLFLASRAITTFPRTPTPILPLEDQYADPATCLRVLAREGGVRELTPPAMPRKSAPWKMYRVVWGGVVKLRAAGS